MARPRSGRPRDRGRREEPAGDDFDFEPESEPAFAGTVAELDASSGASGESPVDDLTDEAEASVPFYKREISFRRKHAVAEESVAVDAVVAAEEAVDDAVESGSDSSWLVPAADVAAAEVETVPVAEAVDEVVAPAESPARETIEVEQPVPSAEHGATEDIAADDPTDDLTHEPVDADPAETVDEADTDEVAAEDLSPVPVAAAVSLPALDVLSEDDDLFIEDSPPSKGRFSSRKDKAPKRKPARGGKGRRVVGLKIGASQIAAAVVTETNGGHELVELARRPLAAGIVVDGEIRDLDALSNALKAFFEDEKLPKKDVRIGLSSNRIGVRTFDIVGIDDEARFDNAVRFKAHEVLPVAAHESVLDYRVVEERPNEAGEASRRVLLVVAPRDQVERYAEVARRVGIKLAGIDLEALGLLRAFVDPQPYVRAVDDTASVVVSIGHESSTLLVAGGGACEFTRVIDWGGSALEDAIATSLEVHPAEAATILRHLSLSGAGRQLDALDEVTRARALDAVRLRLTPFARELVSSLQFYQTQSESLGIGGIVITGGTSHLEGLAEALHQMIGVDVSVGDPLARVTCAGDFAPAIEAVIGSMAVPIGLAIDDIAMRGVDLLPKDAVSVKSTRSTMIAIGAPIAAVVPLVVVGALYMGAHGSVSDKQAQLDAVRAEIAALPAPTGPDIDAGVVGAEAVRATAVAGVLGGRVAWDAVFSDLARVLPANVSLTGLSAKQPASSVLADATTTAVAATSPRVSLSPRESRSRATPTPSRMWPCCSRASPRFRPSSESR